MEELELKANEPYTWTSKQTAKLTIYADAPCAVMLQGEAKTPLPGGVNQSVFMFRVRAGDEVDFVPLGSAGVSIGIVVKPSASPYDPVDPESLVETLAPEEMNLYDRLRAEMLGMLSQFADKNDLETVEEADDFEVDDDDDPLINTPYEYAAMMDEYPVEDTPPGSEPTPSTESAAEPTPSESEPEADGAENTPTEPPHGS